DYESKWDDIRLFIEYGMLTDDKFRDAAMKFVLLKDTEGKYFTLEEYRKLIETAQTDSAGDVVYLYTTDPTAQYNYITAATDRGYGVLVMDGQLDSHFVGMLESKLEKSRFVRVDSDTMDNLIPKADRKDAGLGALERDVLTSVFRSQIPNVEKAEFVVMFESLGSGDAPVTVTQNEYMRRMKEMAAMQPGMSFYGQLPDSYSLVVNVDHPLVTRVRTEAMSALGSGLEPDFKAMTEAQAKADKIRSEAVDGKLTDEQQAESAAAEKTVGEMRTRISDAASGYASGQPLVRQLVDLSLLSSGLLRGKELSDFVKRSVSLL
ncbi:MAG: molecular chaperone HtpG, partial [Muribaculaceae bacterium]|nr:molecular chaperone HtpG [Muribaculaceae bacterium]